MSADTRAARALGRRYRLTLEREPRGRLGGDRLGRSSGSSLEFQDRRAYAAGDDVRHLDWRAFARTEKLLVRQYRDEILPTVDLVVDGSRSMAVEPAKEERARELATFLTEAALGAGCRTRVLLAGERPERLEALEFLERGPAFDGTLPLARALPDLLPGLAPGSLRLVLSDLLFPGEPDELLRAVARGGSGLAVAMLLGPEDVDPPADALELEDCEDGARRDLVIDASARARYLERGDPHLLPHAFE